MTNRDNDAEPLDTENLNDFDWLANVYTRQGAMNHPSELHGIVIGELAGGLKRTASDWLEQVLEHMGLEELNSNAQANVVEDLLAFYQSNLENIDKDSSSFVLLLPDDDYELTQRVEALVQWVRGFLEGIAVSANAKLNVVSDDLKEILQDLVEISQMDARVENSEESEREFFEVSEYVRIGVLNLYAEFCSPDLSSEQDAAKPTLH